MGVGTDDNTRRCDPTYDTYYKEDKLVLAKTWTGEDPICAGKTDVNFAFETAIIKSI